MKGSRDMKIVVEREKCRAAGDCVVTCPQDAISMVDGVAVIDELKCDLDGICIPACPNGAISFSEEE
jgi:NAD-dependent dihydropyrimidine dehydrogenase PreA subunit